MWGEDINNMRLRKPKLFHTFSNKGVEIEEVALGRRHGVIRTNEERGSVYGWGDGTYGELGTLLDLPFEKPVKIEAFEAKRIKKI